MIDQLGRYKVVRELGAGGMAKVFLARTEDQNGFEKWVAIKRPRLHLGDDEHVHQMFLDEARLLAQLEHDNICPIIDLIVDHDGPALVMPYLHGEALTTVIRHHRRLGAPAPIELMVHVAAKVADALHHAHRAKNREGKLLGLIHRDISPQNIMITYEGAVKLLDFGVAKVQAVTQQTNPGEVKGKYAYMSPEQARGELVDRRSDLFSLGIVLYEAISGLRLFKRKSPLDTMRAVLADPVPALSALHSQADRALELILDKALKKDRESRFSEAKEVSTALRVWLADRRCLLGPIEVGELLGSMFPVRAQSHDPLSSPTEPITLPAGSDEDAFALGEPGPDLAGAPPPGGGVGMEALASEDQRPTELRLFSGAAPTLRTEAAALPDEEEAPGGAPPESISNVELEGPSRMAEGTAVTEEMGEDLPTTVKTVTFAAGSSANKGGLGVDDDLAIDAEWKADFALIGQESRRRRAAVVGAILVIATGLWFLAPRPAPPLKIPTPSRATGENTSVVAHAVDLEAGREPEVLRVAPAEAAQVLPPPAKPANEPAISPPIPRAIEPPIEPAAQPKHTSGEGGKGARASQLAMRGRRALFGGDLNAAERSFRACIAAEGPAECHRQLGVVYQRKGKKEQAQEQYRKYLELAHDAPDAAQIEATLLELSRS